MEFTHMDEDGNAVMVDVGDKGRTKRSAVAVGRIYMNRTCFDMIRERKHKKGDVLTVSQIAGIMGAKKTGELIPLCHNITLSNAKLSFELCEKERYIEVFCQTSCEGKTGVEMEALTGVSISLLTIYDMCKSIDRSMRITDIHLLEKMGGKSGHFVYERDEAND